MVNCTNKPNLRITGPAGWGRAWYARYPLLRHAIGEKRQMPGVWGQSPRCSTHLGTDPCRKTYIYPKELYGR
jgi:hypothetical protein